jgi:hypothetical protein
MPVAELVDRVSWAELRHWLVWYQMEADATLPKDRRPIRPRTREEAAAALDRAVQRMLPPS